MPDIILLEKLRKLMKEKCRDVNPMSLNFGHINEVFNEVRYDLIEKREKRKPSAYIDESGMVRNRRDYD